MEKRKRGGYRGGREIVTATSAPLTISAGAETRTVEIRAPTIAIAASVEAVEAVGPVGDVREGRRDVVCEGCGVGLEIGMRESRLCL